MKCKIVIAGDGEVAAATAERVLTAGLGEVVLLGAGAPLARELGEAVGPVRAADSWDAAAGAQVVVLAEQAGPPVELADRCPDAVVVVVADPVEEACAAVLTETRFPRARVLGAGGVVEGVRLGARLAGALGVAPGDVSALVLGGRGSRAVPVLDAARVAGIAVTDKLPADTVARFVAELHGGPPAAPRTVAAAVAPMIETLTRDRRAVLPCVILCQGELGLSSTVAGVPVVLGAEGVERVLDPGLDGEARAALAASGLAYPAGRRA
jgi:malate dehydrogenase